MQLNSSTTFNKAFVSLVFIHIINHSTGKWRDGGRDVVEAVTQSLCTTSGYLEFEMDGVPALNRLLLACQRVQRLPKMMKNEYHV